MSRSNYITNSSLYFQVFTEEQCKEIHSATLEVLERVGAEIKLPEAVALLKDAGAYVEGTRVKFPPALIEKCIRSAPSRVVLCNREGERIMFLENSNSYFGPGPTVNNTLDPFTGERRLVKIADTRQASLVMDALPNIDYQMDFGTARDVKTDAADIHMFEAMLNNSTKPIVHWGFSAKNYKHMVDMAIEISGSLKRLQNYPFLCFYSEPISPLTHDIDALAKTIFMARHNLPCINTPAPLAGATAPSTLAGTLVVANAECLSGLVVHQLSKEGAPFIMGGVTTILDMATTQISYGAPEFNLLSAGMTKMAQYYKIPSFSTAGCSDSKCVDQQMGIDIATNCLMAALSGANLIHDVGFIESGISTSLLQMIIADEVIGQVKQMIKGIEVNKETLAVDLIEKVGPGGHYLTEEHTFENFRKHWWFPTLFSRKRYDFWAAEGKPDLADLARDKLKEIIENHKPLPLENNIKEKINKIVQKA
ncbi:MAG: trimethylamine methyltransferase family protein [Bacillota bacterium]|nr:trimethylamine methyltransferase family protein [Bacillota bacterium]